MHACFGCLSAMHSKGLVVAQRRGYCTSVRLEVTHVQSFVCNDTTCDYSVGGLDKVTTWHKLAHQPIASTSFNEYKSR